MSLLSPDVGLVSKYRAFDHTLPTLPAEHPLAELIHQSSRAFIRAVVCWVVIEL